jgi:hypothetical protein
VEVVRGVERVGLVDFPETRHQRSEDLSHASISPTQVVLLVELSLENLGVGGIHMMRRYDIDEVCLMCKI